MVRPEFQRDAAHTEGRRCGHQAEPLAVQVSANSSDNYWTVTSRVADESAAAVATQSDEARLGGARTCFFFYKHQINNVYKHHLS